MKPPNFKIAPLLIILVLLFLISLFIPNKILAFEDYFSEIALDSNKWQYYENDGQIDVSDGFVSLSSNSNRFPYVYAKQNPFPESGDFVVKIKIQYTYLTLRGGGVTIGNFIPPNNISDSYFNSHAREIMLFQVLNDSFHHLQVVYVPCVTANGCAEDISVFQLGENNTELNEFQIIYSESRYKLIFNETLVFTSEENIRRPTTFYIGNPTNQGSPYTWSSFRLDSVEINPSIPIPSSDPIVLLPGLGASWNHEAMILKIHKDPEDWYMTPFIKTYDGLIQTLKNAGYENTGENKNLFIFNYDWRQPVDTIATQLNNYIENTVDPPSETKIDLIGHSLGGMVARAYVQNDPNHQIDQLITLGSPHKGAPQVYYLWEGVDLKRTLAPWQKIGAGILLHLNKKDYQNNVETIRAMVPVLRNLLPTSPYLKHNGSEKPLSEMSQRNNWLDGLNQLPLPKFLTSVLNIILGVKENSTLRWINVEDRNRFDQFLGKWEDGRPIGEEFDSGDETVLVESAQIEGANVIELSGLNHGDLVETAAGQEEIIDLLELSPSDIISAPEITYEPSLVFQLASSANMTIDGPGDWQIGEGVVNNIPNAVYSSNDKFVFIPKPVEGEYKVHITPEGEGGEYRLLVGLITETGDYWEQFANTVEIGTTNLHEFWSPSSVQTETFIFLTQSKTEIFNLKKYFNKEKIPPKIRGKIERRLAIIMARINGALNLLEEGNTNKSCEKASQAFSILEELPKYINSLSLPKEIKNSLIGPLKEIENYLSQICEFE